MIRRLIRHGFSLVFRRSLAETPKRRPPTVLEPEDEENTRPESEEEAEPGDLHFKPIRNEPRIK